MTNVKGAETTTSTTVKILTQLMKVKCQENMVDLKYVVNNIDNVQDLDANNPSELVNFPPKGQAHHMFSRILNLRIFVTKFEILLSLIFISIFDLNRKLLTCQKTKQK